MRGMWLPLGSGLIILAGLTVIVLAAPPTWTDPTTDATFSLASTECTVLYHKITELTADSTDATTVYISIVSQSPNDGVFTQGVNPANSNDILECTAGSVTTSTYTVVVRAKHSDGNEEYDDLTLTITFTDQATAAEPVWVKPNPDSTQPDHKILMEETTQNGTVILTLEATDADTDAASLMFNMDQSPSTTTALFEVVNKQLKVRDNVTPDNFDLEKIGGVIITEYRIVLEVTDGDSSEILTTNIIVTDVNDNSPTFSGNFEKNISPHVSEGFVVFEVTVVDSDKSTANNQVTLSLLAGAPSEFVLNETSIVVAANANFDFDSVPSYTISVQATDGERNTSQDYIVNIDAAPVWIEPDPDNTTEEHLINICETIQAGDEVMQLAARDNDTDTASLIFSMERSSNESKALFEIVGNKLKVKADVATDFFDVDGDNPVLKILIELDASDGSLTTPLSTAVIVEDDNDNRPIFSGDFTGYVLENSPPGTPVLKLTATDNDLSAEFNTVSFSLSGASEFKIGGNNNDTIVVAEGADLDASMTSSYNVTVTASDSDPNIPQTTEQTYTIYITSKPVFNTLQTDQVATVSEDADENVGIYSLTVTDDDTTDTVTVSIFEQPTPEMFRLDGQVLKPKSGVTFDAEGNAVSFLLKFKASDGTNEVESAVLTVNVTDVNDNPPVFTELDPVVEISEKTFAGASVYDANATDADIGNPDNVMKFSMTQPAPDRFSIDEDSGVISVKAGVTLSFEEKSEFELVVTASDGTAPTDLSANTTVTVKLKTGPVFTDPTNGSIISIFENITIGGVAKTLTVKDNDGDTPTFTILSQEPASPVMFQVNGTDIVTTATFDVDTTNAVKAYVLEIKASDGREYTDDDTITVTVNIDDVNDNSPEFAQTVYTKEVKETEAIDTTILSVTATDKDSTPENNKLTYTLSGTTDFKINETSGDIIVAKTLNYATTKSYDITVTATDSGTPENMATSNVNITILTEPKFDNLAVAVSKDINENLPANTPVFSISISDLDKTWDNTVSIVSQTPAGMFKVNGTTVETETDGLDAENVTEYKLTFQVIDGQFTVNSAELTFNIVDLNDNPPDIPTILPVALPENQTVGSEVFTIQATDNDVTAPNNVMSYSIISGDENNTFAINISTGSVALAKTLLLETYDLKVQVSDGGNPIKTATADVSVYVDANVVDECSTNPCKNGATCLSSVNRYTCVCVPGFIDTNCETNRNECDPDPCMNAGTCTDHINFHSCNCTEGWEGKNCTDACTNNTYGRNCQNQCSCNATRLVSGVDNQQCDIVGGNCKCNSNWVGASCEDRDECADPSICGRLPNVVCENTIGGFYCTCEQGYVNTSSVCSKDTRPVLIEIKAGQVRVHIQVSIGNTSTTICDREALKIPSKYQLKKREIEEMINRGLPSNIRFVVIQISCGSLEYEAVIIIDQNDAATFANELANMSNTVQFEGQTVTVNEVIVNGSTVNKSGMVEQKVCTAYTAIEPCAVEYECVYRNNNPSCQKIEKDNTGLILGLGLGVCLPLVLLLVLAAFYLYYVIRKRRTDDRRRRKLQHRSSSRKEESPWHGRMKQNGFRMDTRNYDRNHFYDNTAYFDMFTDKKNNHDMPGLGYTTM